MSALSSGDPMAARRPRAALDAEPHRHARTRRRQRGGRGHSYAYRATTCPRPGSDAPPARTAQETPFSVFQHFGMQSGKDVNKFAGKVSRTENGIAYVEGAGNAVLSVDVNNTVDVGTHTIFIGEVTEEKILSDVPSASYQYYFDHIKGDGDDAGGTPQ